MTATATFYNSIIDRIADGTVDITTHTFKVSLHTSTYTPNAETHAVYADLTNQLSTANGYTSGGATLANVTFTRSTTTGTFDADDTEWTATDSGITARYAVVYDDSSANKDLVLYILLDNSPADVTAVAAEILKLTWNASGIITITI